MAKKQQQQGGTDKKTVKERLGQQPETAPGRFLPAGAESESTENLTPEAKFTPGRISRARRGLR